jgi:hypothetical protein
MVEVDMVMFVPLTSVAKLVKPAPSVCRIPLGLPFEAGRVKVRLLACELLDCKVVVYEFDELAKRIVPVVLPDEPNKAEPFTWSF